MGFSKSVVAADILQMESGSVVVVYSAQWSLSASSGMFGLLMRVTVRGEGTVCVCVRCCVRGCTGTIGVSLCLLC